MRIEVRLYASLERAHGIAPGAPLAVELPPGASLRSVIEALDIQPARVHLAFVNGIAVSEWSQPLSDNDRVGLFPPVGGG
jgi:molybdopterin converting factor small subunit